MAKAWYPVVNEALCTRCGLCVAKCPHGVYDKALAPKPAVTAPEECVDHCHGCGNRCPAGAITYHGEDTGWTPPKAKAAADNRYGCGCETAATNQVLVEFLYLDVSTCERCIGTQQALESVLAAVEPTLAQAGLTLVYRKLEMSTPELAQQYRFLSSPTIRVNGVDIGGAVQENPCACCGELSGTEVACRVFAHDGQTYEVPPRDLLTANLLRVALAPREAGCACEAGCSCAAEPLPDNLKTFYDGRRRIAGRLRSAQGK